MDNSMKQEEFLKGINDWNNHAPLLWLALEETKSGDVLEFGCGDGSTNQLHQYCKDNNRMLYSFDSDETYLNKFKHLESDNHKFILTENEWHGWDIVSEQYGASATVCLIDHSKGERRRFDAERMKDIKGILVLHDTQPKPTAAGYNWEMIWDLFKYKCDLTCPIEPISGDNRTWGSAVSNWFDVSAWKGQTFKKKEYEIK